MKLKLNNGQNLYFTSDTHYNHKNICKGVSNWDNTEYTRDFPNLDSMNTTIVSNINEKVKEDDILFHIGDWSFGGFDKIEEFRKRINCKNIHIILGNHDHHIQRDKQNIQSIFSSVSIYKDLQVLYNDINVNFILMHYPIASWNNMGRGSIHIHGHVHLLNHHKIGKGKSIDVGVDGNNLSPYSLTEIISLMENQPISNLSLPIDHHEQNDK